VCCGCAQTSGSRQSLVMARRLLNHQPQTEVELLKRGFHIAYISVDPTPKSLTEWDAWYAYLTNQYGLSKNPRSSV